jgi:hypothetical protein
MAKGKWIYTENSSIGQLAIRLQNLDKFNSRENYRKNREVPNVNEMLPEMIQRTSLDGSGLPEQK